MSRQASRYAPPGNASTRTSDASAPGVSSTGSAAPGASSTWSAVPGVSSRGSAAPGVSSRESAVPGVSSRRSAEPGASPASGIVDMQPQLSIAESGLVQRPAPAPPTLQLACVPTTAPSSIELAQATSFAPPPRPPSPPSWWTASSIRSQPAGAALPYMSAHCTMAYRHSPATSDAVHSAGVGTRQHCGTVGPATSCSRSGTGEHAYEAVSWIQSVTSPARPRNRTCSAAACVTAFPLVRCHSSRVNSQNVPPPTPETAAVVVAAAGGSSERLTMGANGRPHTCLPRESTSRTRIGPSSSPAALVATSWLTRSM